MDGFQVGVGGFRPTWVALAWRGSCVVVGRGWPSMVVSAHG